MQNQNSVKLASAKWEIIPKCEIGKISADSKCKVFEKKKNATLNWLKCEVASLAIHNGKWLGLWLTQNVNYLG